jgi:hypothetical protein
VARRCLRGIPIGAGTAGNFSELNRNRPDAESIDAIAYGVCPQIHAADDLSIIENLPAQRDAIATARTFAPEAAIAVGPVSLARRPDAFAEGLDGAAVPAVLDDPRHRGDFAAAWTLGSIKHLAEAGASSITLFDAVGPLGVMSAAGGLYPVGALLRDVARFAGAAIHEVTDPDPLRCAALAVREGPTLRVFLANLQNQASEIAMEGLPRMILPPYGVQMTRMRRLQAEA